MTHGPINIRTYYFLYAISLPAPAMKRSTAAFVLWGRIYIYNLYKKYVVLSVTERIVKDIFVRMRIN